MLGRLMLLWSSRIVETAPLTIRVMAATTIMSKIAFFERRRKSEAECSLSWIVLLRRRRKSEAE